MTQELKPCPFCGGRAYFERTGAHRQSAIVACGSCGCRHESGHEHEQSANGWNTREPAIEADRQARGETVKKPSHETIGLVGVIANKIEDGTLFNAGIFSRKELAEKVREVLIFAAQPELKSIPNGAMLYTTPQPQQIPEGSKRMPKDTKEFILRAMARNYRNGHSWDHLDSEACEKAADEIRHLRAMLEAAPEPKEPT